MKSRLSPTILFSTRFVVIALVFAGSGFLGSAQSIPGTMGGFKSKEVRVGQWYWSDADGPPVVSPDGRHVAYADRTHCEKGSIMCVFLDGEAIPAEHGTYVGQVAISPDGKRAAFESSKASMFVTGNQEHWVVVDGKREVGYNTISQMVFSPDGKHLAYSARTWTSGRSAFSMVAGNVPQWKVVLDGVEGPAYPEGLVPIPMNPFFTPDGRLVYSAWRDKRRFFVIDGKEVGAGWSWALNPSFNPDWKRLAFVGCQQANKDCSAIVDGKPGPVYDEIYRNFVFFSPDGKHFWYGGKKNGKWTAVVDGNQGPFYDQIYNQYCQTSAQVSILPFQPWGLEKQCWIPSYSFFSPDGKHTWYTAKKGDHWVAVEDGQEGSEFADISANAFSPDNSHIAFAAWESGKSSAKLQLDGKEIATAERIANPFFSPDSNHVGFVTYKLAGLAGVKWAMAVDSQIGAEYSEIGQSGFSPDSKHFAYLAKATGGKWTVVIDGRESGEYSLIVPGTFKFGADGALEFLAVRKDPDSKNGNSLYRVKYTPNP